MQVQELRGKLSKNLLHEVKMYALLCFEIKLMYTLWFTFSSVGIFRNFVCLK